MNCIHIYSTKLCIYLRYFLLLFCLFLFFACKKLVTVSAPVTANTSSTVFASDATAISVLTGLYDKMSSGSLGNAGSFSSLSLFVGLSADELTLYSGVTNVTALAYYRNSLSGGTAGVGSDFWITIYPYIYVCNSALEGLKSSNGLTPVVKQQLTGEALFLRALYYCYLSSLYGDVPLSLTSNYKNTESLARSSQSQVLQQAIEDLKSAQSLLSSTYLDGTLLKSSLDRVRPTVGAATALLARLYLYIGDNLNAEAEATSIINDSALYKLSDIANVFLRAGTTNSEPIWQLQPVNMGWNTEDAKAFIIPSTGPNTGYNFGAFISPYLLNSFEGGDRRRRNWVDSITISGTTYYYPYKYKINTINSPVTEFLTILRLGEQYLIRAEARAQLDDIKDAVADLNVIRARAGLLSYSGSTDKSSVLAAIMHERQVELFTEFGHRWIDIRRTDVVNSIMGSPENACGGKGGNWNAIQQLYPLPLSDLLNDQNLVQNPGY